MITTASAPEGAHTLLSNHCNFTNLIGRKVVLNEAKKLLMIFV